MTEPTRLAELGANDLRARLVRSAMPDAPDEGAHDRAALALGLGVPIAAGGAAVANTASKSLLGMIAKWLGIGALAGLVTSGAATATYDAWTRSPPAIRTIESPPKGVEPARVSTNPPEPATAKAAEIPAASAESKPADTLSDELAWVDQARSQLAKGNARGALTLLDQYSAAYPRARLADESTALRVEALVALGRRAEAVALADRFLANRADSAFAQRVRKLVGR